MHGTVALLETAALRRVEARGAHACGDDAALMERAGEAAWRSLLQHWPQAQRICIACGPGNNGGDGYMLARHALAAGRRVAVVHAPGVGARSPLCVRARDAFVAAGGRIEQRVDVPEADLVVDALFGIGIARALEGTVATLVHAINAQPAPVLALDVPSGIDADRGGAAGPCVRASRTLQFIAGHPGLHTGAALDHAGARDVASLALPASVFDGIPATAHLLGPDALPGWLPARARDTHKGASGRVLCVGGELGGGGAILLAAEGALRAGAGLVEVATRGAHVTAMLARRPEVMAHAVEDPASVAALASRAGVLAIGPGLGVDAWGRAICAHALDAAAACVIDADALNQLARSARPVPADAILTPHPGEAARLLDCPVAQVQADRFGAARELARRHGAVVVLKGAGTIIAAPGEVPRVIGAGNPGMAVGGMGDLLTGVIAALRAQGLAAFDAACCGALLHAVAGDHAASEGGERGMLPGDLLPWLRRFANPWRPA